MGRAERTGRKPNPCFLAFGQVWATPSATQQGATFTVAQNLDICGCKRQVRLRLETVPNIWHGLYIVMKDTQLSHQRHDVLVNRCHCDRRV